MIARRSFKALTEDVTRIEWTEKTAGCAKVLAAGRVAEAMGLRVRALAVNG